MIPRLPKRGPRGINLVPFSFGQQSTSMSKSRCIFILLFCTFARATPEEFQYSPAAMKLLSKMDEQTNATVGRGRVYIDIRLACLLASNEIVLQNECVWLSVCTGRRFSVFSVFWVLEHFVRVSGRVLVLVLLCRCTRVRVRTIAEWVPRGLIETYFAARRGLDMQ